MSKVTIKDVAKVAGVSISTVSNALNDVDVLKPETKAHILKVAQDLNYIPNQQGKLLKSKYTRHIMFITSTLSGPYFNRLTEALHHICHLNDYTLHIVIAESETDLKNALLGHRYDGYIVFMPHIQNSILETYQKSSGSPIIAIDRMVDNVLKSVTFNNEETMYQLTNQLINSGLKTFLFIEGRDEMYDARSRKQGFIKAVNEHSGLIYTTLKGDFSKDTAYSLVHNHLDSTRNHYDALVCANDQMAIGAMDALKRREILIPQETSVTGFDNIELSEYVTPTLTTVNNDLNSLAMHCMELLFNMINGDEVSSRVLNGTLINRNSTKHTLR